MRTSFPTSSRCLSKSWRSCTGSWRSDARSDSTVVKVTFKNIKTKKSTTLKYRCVVKAAKEEEAAALKITDVTATKVDELTVTFASAVEDTAAVTLAVTKAGAAVETSSTKWADDKTSVVIKTVAKMTKGTYTVTAKTETEETSGTAEVVSQYVADIKILNDVALTGALTNGSVTTDAALAYVYYDVVDQYGESMRNSTTIEWSTSVKVRANDKAAGKLTLERTDNKAFTYGEQVYVTGVYSKTGVSVSKTLTIGAKQALNSVEVAGFAKKGTTTLVQSLPAGFKSGAYYIVYSVLDQNGNAMDATGKYIEDNEITFISDNVLVLKEITKTGETTLTIDGIDYNAAIITPGQNVDKGGEVNVTAIANKTGNKTTINVVIGNGQILKSFTISQPAGIVADGETAEIPFTALDQDGKEITNFVTLASQSDFSNLSLNASEGTLTLKENNDGTAKLEWSDTGSNGAWNASSEDGIDRPISLTTVVVGGDTSNEMIYVSDKAYPVAIKDVNLDSVYLNAGSATLRLRTVGDDKGTFRFLDQYGRQMGKDDEWGDDNGFFAYQNTDGLSGSDFKGYTYGVKAEYKGANDILDTTSDIKDSSKVKFLYEASKTATLTIRNAATASATGDLTLKFSIAKVKNTDINDTEKLDNVSTIKNHSFKVVNITKVSGMAISDLNKVYVNTIYSDAATGELAGISKDDLATAVTDAAVKATILDDYKQKVVVKGTYNGASVTVPAQYYSVSGSKVCSTAEATATEKKINAVTGSAVDFSLKDLYDATTAKYTRKDASDTLKVTVYPLNAFGDATKVVDTASKVITISDAAPYAAEIVAKDTYTFTPNQTSIAGDTTDGLKKVLVAADKDYKVLDQYKVAISADESYKVSGIAENAERYAENNFTVSKNDTQFASIFGAELGDTFTLTISAKAGNVTVTKEIKITVGADKKANITGSFNTYMKELVGHADLGLEKQRNDALGN